MKTKITTILILLFTVYINAQTVIGKWNSRDENTGEVDSVIEVYEKNGKVFGKIIDIIDQKNKVALCTLCTGSKKDKPVLGLHILYKLEHNGNQKWSGGYGLDPRKGNYFNVYIKLINPNKLKIRGYAGIPLFGKTVYWERVQ